METQIDTCLESGSLGVGCMHEEAKDANFLKERMFMDRCIEWSDTLPSMASLTGRN